METPRPLRIAALIAGIVAAAAITADVARRIANGMDRRGRLLTMGYTTQDEGHITATNISDGPVFACFTSVVESKRSPEVKVRSLVVCSGYVPPKSTVSMLAPYPFGAVHNLCSDSSREFDWTNCTVHFEDASDL